ncbi:glycoside hydrolase family 25 protein [Mycobacterium sp.]|uniref:glycoside hydrolase family 25 protein n=1 Tax=Mycobacterium sp. TaxID=1785 RepID=UPI0031D492CF
MTVRGVDVSSWQHPGGAPIDWWKVADAGYRFVIIKATQGVGYTNPWWERDYSDAFAAGLLVGAYHYYEAGVDPAAQAAHFVGTLVGRQLDAGCWLDYEVGFSAAWQVGGEVKGFIDAAADGRPQVGVYCDGNVYGALAESSSIPARVWLATWGASGPAHPAMVWQSGSATVPGVPDTVDVDEWIQVRGLNLPTAPPAPTVTSVAEDEAKLSRLAAHEEDQLSERSASLLGDTVKGLESHQKADELAIKTLEGEVASDGQVDGGSAPSVPAGAGKSPGGAGGA